MAAKSCSLWIPQHKFRVKYLYILIRIHSDTYIAQKQHGSCIFKIMVSISPCANMQWILQCICALQCVLCIKACQKHKKNWQSYQPSETHLCNFKNRKHHLKNIKPFKKKKQNHPECFRKHLLWSKATYGTRQTVQFIFTINGNLWKWKLMDRKCITACKAKKIMMKS